MSLGSIPAIAQTSLPGAVQSNGNFFVLKQTGNTTAIWEWNNGASVWTKRLDIPGVYGRAIGGATPTGGFHFTVTSVPLSNPYLLRWEPGNVVSNYYYPSGWPSTLSAPGPVMYGNRVMIVGDNKLYERFFWGNTSWFSHGMASGFNPIRNVPPCILNDGKLFVTTVGGEVQQLWWNTANSSWNWFNHGYPKSPNYFGQNGVKAMSVGAPMPSTNKVFVTCDNGSLRQIYYNGSNWTWFDHGIPFGWRVDSPAIATADGKVYVTGNWMNGSTTVRTLLLLYWNGSSWVWFDHGRPPNTDIAGGAIAKYGSDNVIVKATNGKFYMIHWTSGTTWAWKDCGAP